MISRIYANDSAHALSAPIIVENIAAFMEAAERCPRDILVLRSPTPPTAAEVRRYCLALGGLLQFESAGDVRTVKNDPMIPNSTAMSTDALSLHTDGAFLDRPPRRFLLSFTTKDPAGAGVSTFMPLARIVSAAPDWVLEALYTADYRFVRTYDGDLTDSYVGPALTKTNTGVHIRWRSDHIWRPNVADRHGTRAEDAVDWLHEYLSISEPETLAAEAGDTLLVPNTIMLHGRSRLSPNSTREVLRAWVS